MLANEIAGTFECPIRKKALKWNSDPDSDCDNHTKLQNNCLWNKKLFHWFKLDMLLKGLKLWHVIIYVLLRDEINLELNGKSMDETEETIQVHISNSLN